jgi:predicted O-methyltransferase YrrM
MRELAHIKELIPIAKQKLPTGDVWLDTRFQDLQHPYYKLFYLMAQIFSPRLIVELGTDRATGAAHFAAGYPNGIVITIDTHLGMGVEQDKTREVLIQYSNVQYINGDTCSRKTLARVGEFAPVDMLFIDSLHSGDHARKEYDFYSPLLANDAIVICHDIEDAPGYTTGMVKFWNGLPEPKFLASGLHNMPMGFVLVVK